MIGIQGLGAYAPERVMENVEWQEHFDTTDEWIKTRTGIERRRVAAEDQTTVDLASKAAERALEDANVDISEIDEIIVTTDTPEVYLPDTASFLQDRLGAREIPSYDLAGSGCAGFLQGIDVARSRALTGKNKVLVVGVELLTRLIDWKDRSTAVLFGDAAGAVVIGEVEEPSGILSAVAGTDGSRWDILCLETGGTRRPFTLEQAQKGSHRAIVMNGREVFKSAVGRMSQAAREVLEMAGKTLHDVDLFVPHQANLRIIRAVGKALGAAEEKIFINVQDYGNTGSASVPLALAQAREEGRVASGDLVLLASFGAGFHWAATLVRL